MATRTTVPWVFILGGAATIGALAWFAQRSSSRPHYGEFVKYEKIRKGPSLLSPPVVDVDVPPGSPAILIEQREGMTLVLAGSPGITGWVPSSSVVADEPRRYAE